MNKEQNTYWIELKNADDFNINLANWKLEIGSSNTISLPNFILKPNQFLTLDSATYQFSLASSDSLTLKNSYNKIISKIDYQELPDGLSIAKLKNQDWQITTTPTFNKENVFTEIKNFNKLAGSVTEANINNDNLATKTNDLVSTFDPQTYQNHKLSIDFFMVLLFIISISLTTIFMIIKNKLIY